ncbi:hypothetical protein PV326_010508 [Microctonus aethiopoides]|uniref:Secreted protein n=1 Tax=Microctonus aethiopoides TaxID=144406 RepID=A0AA39KUA8_9HYME|nr:hypothetical protein PV326_010508 [Microctonus aethiopoides]KAK0174188.1 hypothetical protein PV328_007297 [Microctonus aethiopoides]
MLAYKMRLILVIVGIFVICNNNAYAQEGEEEKEEEEKEQEDPPQDGDKSEDDSSMGGGGIDLDGILGGKVLGGGETKRKRALVDPSTDIKVKV